jgi:hypothetical protein
MFHVFSKKAPLAAGGKKIINFKTFLVEFRLNNINKEVFMKILPLILLVMLCLVFCSTNDHDAQANVVKEVKELTGVKFEQMSFTDTLAKALKENKILMIDNYTDT